MKNLLKIGVCAFAFIMLLPFSSNAAGKKAEGYNIILPENIEHGKIESNKLTAKKKETVILTITSDNGYEFNGLSIRSGGKDVKYIEIIKNEQYSFVMPKNDVNVFVGFKKIIIPVRSISMDSDLKLEIGETKQLFATIKPENATVPKITWTSDNEKVATVDNGLVTGISIGSATIRVNCNGRRANCNVNVKLKMAKPTDTVQYLPAGTDGTMGTEGTYVLFGDWPQTLKAKDVEIDETVSEVHGDFTYYAGSDGYWYVKYKEKFVERDPDEDEPSIIIYEDGTISYSNSNNSVKYFKVEPIKWRVLNPKAKQNEKKILLAEEVLFGNFEWGYGGTFLSTYKGERIQYNNYEYSNIRAYLNGTKNQRLINEIPNTEGTPIDWTNKGFYYTAFIPSARKLIADTIVENDSDSANPIDNPTFYNDNYWTHPYGSTTTDKIFLPSVEELTTEQYGFNRKSEFEDPRRQRNLTDFASANSILNYNEFDENDNGIFTLIKKRGTYWWTRSPSFRFSMSVHEVDLDGFIGVGKSGYDKDNRYGYVPALTLE